MMESPKLQASSVRPARKDSLRELSFGGRRPFSQQSGSTLQHVLHSAHEQAASPAVSSLAPSHASFAPDDIDLARTIKPPSLRQQAKRQCDKLLSQHSCTLILCTLCALTCLLCALLVPESHNTFNTHTLSGKDTHHYFLKGARCDQGHPYAVSFNGTTTVNAPESSSSSSSSSGSGGGPIVAKLTCQSPALGWEAWFTMAVTGIALTAMTANFPPDLVMLSGTVILVLAGIIDGSDAWNGFSNEGVLAVAVLFVVARGLEVAGSFDQLLRGVLGQPKSLFAASMRMSVPVGIISGFMNNTPVVALMIPILESWSARSQLDKAKLLIPLSYASMLGGMCTLIGTSTNLMAAGLLRRYDPNQSVTMFELAKAGLPCLLAGCLYMAVCAPYLLPDTPHDEEEEEAQEALAAAAGGRPQGASKTHSSEQANRGYVICFEVVEDGEITEQTLRGCGVLHVDDAELCVIARDNVLLWPDEFDPAPMASQKDGRPVLGMNHSAALSYSSSNKHNNNKTTAATTTAAAAGATAEEKESDITASETLVSENSSSLPEPGSFTLQRNDRLVFTASAEAIVYLRNAFRGMQPADFGESVKALGKGRHRRLLVEGVLSRSSRLVGLTLVQASVSLVHEFNAALLAVRLDTVSRDDGADKQRAGRGAAGGKAGARHTRSLSDSRWERAGVPMLDGKSDLEASLIDNAAGRRRGGGGGGGAGRGVHDSDDLHTDAAAAEATEAAHRPYANFLRQFPRSVESSPVSSPSAGRRRQAASVAVVSPTLRSNATSERVPRAADTAAGPAPVAQEAEAVLRPGDQVLLEAFSNFVQLHKDNADFALVREVKGSRPPRHNTPTDQFRAVFSIVVLIGMVGASAVGVMRILDAAILASCLLVLMGCLTVDEAFRAINGRVILAIVTAFGIGAAIDKTGVAATVADGLVHVGQRFGSTGILSTILIVTAGVTSLVTNNAAVILMFPICLHAHLKSPDTSLKKLMIVLMIGASSAFLTPIAYQTNLMVLGPGGYKFGDFFRFGAPLQLVVTVVAVACAEWFY